MEHVRFIAEWCAGAIELVGIALIVIISLQALATGLLHMMRGKQFHSTVGDIREQLGQGILLGLEFLIGADIIHTVAVDLRLESVGVLALIVLVRTFLSFTLEAELTGRWPWQGNGKSAADDN